MDTNSRSGLSGWKKLNREGRKEKPFDTKYTKIA